MKRFVYIARGLLMVAALLALVPLGRMAADWIEVSRAVNGPVFLEAPARSFDGVVWEEDDGAIVAAYVFPGGPAAETGIKAGDLFYMLEFQQYFNARDLQQAIEGIPPGQTRTYYVRRGQQFEEVRVTLARYPTFLYPLSEALWHFALWGFTLGAFFHLLGLVITAPLARRARRARFSLLLIAASSLWMFSTALRLVLVEGFGLPAPGSAYDTAFRVLTLVGLVGWIGFPALLVNKVARDTEAAAGVSIGALQHVINGPAVLLTAAALGAALHGRLGPLTPASLVAPILFYACCYIAAAAALMLVFYLSHSERARGRTVPGGWSRQASALLLAGAVLLALCVLGVLPLFGAVTGVTAGWIVVCAQLVAVVPVVLVTLATLRRGKPGHVLSRALTYLTTLGFIFFAYVGGLAVLHLYVVPGSAAYNVASGLYVVALLFLFERLARRLRIYVEHLFATDRQRTRQSLSRFQEQMRALVDHETLAQQTVAVVAEAFDARTARLFIRRGAAATESGRSRWLSSAHAPQAPYLTERVLESVWPYLEREGRIWAANPELNESTLPETRARLLRERGAALAIPIMGDGAPTGLLVLGRKRARRAVYNLEDLDLLRSLSGQLALAVERLDLVVRERLLVRENAAAELVALRAQINPHFLFNALNTIIALIATRPEEAEAAVEHLAAIFRHTLQAEGKAFVPLEEELALVRHYLHIEKARFGDTLAIEVEQEPALSGFPVPGFAVQTLVENAVKHGVGQQRGGGRVHVVARRRADNLVEVAVADTGVGIPALFGQEAQQTQPERFFGIGLRNVAARMEQLYGRADLFRLHSSPEEGTTARLLLPDAPADADTVSDRPGEVLTAGAA